MKAPRPRAIAPVSLGARAADVVEVAAAPAEPEAADEAEARADEREPEAEPAAPVTDVLIPEALRELAAAMLD